MRTRISEPSEPGREPIDGPDYVPSGPEGPYGPREPNGPDDVMQRRAWAVIEMFKLLRADKRVDRNG